MQDHLHEEVRSELWLRTEMSEYAARGTALMRIYDLESNFPHPISALHVPEKVSDFPPRKMRKGAPPGLQGCPKLQASGTESLPHLQQTNMQIRK